MVATAPVSKKVPSYCECHCMDWYCVCESPIDIMSGSHCCFAGAAGVL